MKKDEFNKGIRVVGKWDAREQRFPCLYNDKSQNYSTALWFSFCNSKSTELENTNNKETHVHLVNTPVFSVQLLLVKGLTLRKLKPMSNLKFLGL